MHYQDLRILYKLQTLTQHLKAALTTQNGAILSFFYISERAVASKESVVCLISFIAKSERSSFKIIRLHRALSNVMSGLRK